MAKKKTSEPPKRYGTLVRVSDEFAEALADVVKFERSNVRAFCDAHLLPIVRQRYRAAVLKEARRLEGPDR